VLEIVMVMVRMRMRCGIGWRKEKISILVQLLCILLSLVLTWAAPAYPTAHLHLHLPPPQTKEPLHRRNVPTVLPSPSLWLRHSAYCTLPAPFGEPGLETMHTALEPAAARRAEVCWCVVWASLKLPRHTIACHQLSKDIKSSCGSSFSRGGQTCGV
jgi:hypothetical protein